MQSSTSRQVQSLVHFLMTLFCNTWSTIQLSTPSYVGLASVRGATPESTNSIQIPLGYYLIGGFVMELNWFASYRIENHNILPYRFSTLIVDCEEEFFYIVHGITNYIKTMKKKMIQWRHEYYIPNILCLTFWPKRNAYWAFSNARAFADTARDSASNLEISSRSWAAEP